MCGHGDSLHLLFANACITTTAEESGQGRTHDNDEKGEETECLCLRVGDASHLSCVDFELAMHRAYAVTSFQLEGLGDVSEQTGSTSVSVFLHHNSFTGQTRYRLSLHNIFIYLFLLFFFRLI